MRHRRLLLLGLMAPAALLLLLGAPPTGDGAQPQPAAAQTPRERVEGRLVGPRRVEVKDLPAVSAAVAAAQEPVVIPRRASDMGPRATATDASQVPQANAVDSSVRSGPQALASPDIPDILTSFDGLDSTDNPFALTPPDPQLAVGPNHIIEFVNVVGRITDKSGVPAGSDFLLDDFFGVAPGNPSFDPKIIYDDIDDRFFASYADIDFAFSFGHLFLAISETSDPTGAWNLYFASFAGAIPDYPGIGVTSDKFTISYNLFDMDFGFFIGEQTLVVQKSDVMAGALSAGAVFLPINGSRFTVRPAQNLSPAADQYLTTWNVLASDELTVIKITGTPNGLDVTEAAATNLTTLFHASPPPSVTAGPGLINSGDRRMLESVWRGDSLWSASSAACIPPPETSVSSCAHLVEVETVGAPTVVQDIMFGAPGEYLSWPAIRTDSSANLYVSLTGSNASTFASAKVTGRLATDPLDTMSGTCLLKAGEIVHESSRWGDYLGAAVDPSDPSKVWVVGEYAKDDGDVRWGTYIGSLSHTDGGLCPPQPPPPPPPDNDNFADATVIPEPLPYTNSQTTARSSAEPAEPVPPPGQGCNTAMENTVWYRHTPTSSQTFWADTFGSNYDTQIIVWSGTDVGSLTFVGCNDDTGWVHSQVNLAASAGTTYHFQIDGWGGAAGNLGFSLTPLSASPLVCNGPPVGFSAGIPIDWAVVDNAGIGMVWGDLGSSGEFGNYTGGAGNVASASSDLFGPAPFDTELWGPPFDLPAGGTPSVDYLANYQNYFSSDFLDLDISTDGGSGWTTLLSWNESHGLFRGTPGEAVSVDLSAYAGMSGLILRWHYYDPNPGDDWDWYAQVDDVALTCAGLDSDNDGVPDASDNCPSVPNGSAEAGTPGVGNQTNTDADNEAAGFRLGTGVPPPVLAGDLQGDACDDDDDNDNFRDADERTIYGVGAGSAQELTSCRRDTVVDPWPADIFPAGDPDRVVDVQDAVAALGFVGLAFGDASYSPRMDLVEPGAAVDNQDMLLVLGFVGMSCQPP